MRRSPCTIHPYFRGGPICTTTCLSAWSGCSRGRSGSPGSRCHASTGRSEPGYQATTSVVVPAFREDPEILRRCLDSWLAEDPTEVIVVPDLADRAVITMLKERAADRAEADRHAVRAHGQALRARRRHQGRHARRSWCCPTRTRSGCPGWSARCSRRSPILTSAASAPGRTRTHQAAASGAGWRTG